MARVDQILQESLRLESLIEMGFQAEGQNNEGVARWLEEATDYEYPLPTCRKLIKRYMQNLAEQEQS